MRKYVKTIIVVVVIACLCIGYFFYLSRRGTPTEATDKIVNNQEIAALTTRNIMQNYPESPKEVIKFYARITKAYYKAPITDEQMQGLANQARLLFDDELRATQTDEEFLDALKEDIEEYRKEGRYVSDYRIAESGEVQFTTFQSQKYASLRAVYVLREGKEVRNSSIKYTLRQDSEGRWRILYWELVR